jgi:hypothetical protein
MSKSDHAEVAKMVFALQRLPSLAEDREWLSSFVEQNASAVALGVAVHNGWVAQLSEGGKAEIAGCFAKLAERVGQSVEALVSTCRRP